MGRSQFQSFLERSLEILADEKPGVYARLCEMLDGCELAFVIDDAAVGMRFDPHPVVGAAISEAPAIRVQSDRRTILDVVGGSLTLENAVLGERVELYGSVPNLVRFHDALRVYLNGAVRAPGFAGLLDGFEMAGSSAGAGDAARQCKE